MGYRSVDNSLRGFWVRTVGPMLRRMADQARDVPGLTRLASPKESWETPFVAAARNAGKSTLESMPALVAATCPPSFLPAVTCAMLETQACYHRTFPPLGWPANQATVQPVAMANPTAGMPNCQV